MATAVLDFQVWGRLPQLLTVVVIADRDMHGDSRVADRFDEAQELTILTFGAIGSRSIAIHNRMGGARI